MVTLHSFDEEPAGELVSIWVISKGRERKITVTKKCGIYESENSGWFTWDEIKKNDDFFEGWLYESELMQCVKNGTRSE